MTELDDRSLKTDNINMEIITPEGSAFSGKVQYVNLPGIAGRFGVLTLHAPLIGVLCAGNLYFSQDSTTRTIKIGRGIAKVEKNQLLILTESAE